MNILNNLSSKQGDKTEKSNKSVAELCIKTSSLITEIAAGFDSNDKKLQADCIEVFTMIAETNPQLIVPYASQILPLLSSRETKTRWEAVHTFSIIAGNVPDLVLNVLPDIQELIKKDKSTIVRDYATDIVTNYAKTGTEASEKAFGILKETLILWEEKHAKQVFKGFLNILDNAPAYKAEIKKLVSPYLDAKKNVVVNEAKKIIKRLEQ